MKKVPDKNFWYNLLLEGLNYISQFHTLKNKAYFCWFQSMESTRSQIVAGKCELQTYYLVSQKRSSKYHNHISPTSKKIASTG